MRRLLVLRPEPGASETAARARALGLEPVATPLFEIEPIAWEAPDPAGFDGLLLTSANAVRHAGERLKQYRGLQVYAVGDATARAARDAGFGVAATGDSGVDRLLGSIDGELRLLHLCGEDRREPAEAAQEIRTVAVYRARPVETPDLGPAVDAVALLHSPRAARRLSELVEARGRTIVAAISAATAEAAGEGWEKVATAGEPTDEALLALARRLCNKPPL